MKKITILFSLSFLILSCGQLEKKSNSEIATSSFADSAIQVEKDYVLTEAEYNDTLFLVREFTNNAYRAVYIEKNRDAINYKWLTDFTFHDYAKKGLQYSYKSMLDIDSGIFNKHKTFGLPQDWLPLYSYEDNYYLYSPSDWGNVGRRILNDSALIYWYMMGPDLNPLRKINRLDDKTYNVKFYTSSQDSIITSELNIYILNSETKMALWEFPNNPEIFRWQLYVPKENAHKFDVVVNYSPTIKQLEFEFDTIDFEKLKVDTKSFAPRGIKEIETK